MLALKNHFKQKQNIYWAILVSVFTVILFSFFYKGFFSRYLQDDYCYGSFIRLFGFFKTQVISYMQGAPYNGNRYSLTLFMGIAELLGGVSIIKWLPGFWILLWFGVLVFLFLRIENAFGLKKSYLKAALFAEVILVFTFYLAPELYQVLYWRAGSLPYLPPLVLNTYLVARLVGLLKQKTKWFHFAEFALISFLSAGFSETDAVIQFSLWAILLLLTGFGKVAWLEKNTAVRLISVVMLFSACGLLLLAFSPFNDYALSIRPARQTDLVKFLTLSFRFGFDILYDALKSRWLPFGVLAALGVLFGWYSPVSVQKRKTALQIALLLVATYLLSVSTCTPSVLLGSVYPENRAIFPMHYLMVGSIFILGNLIAKLLRNMRFASGKEKWSELVLWVLTLGIFLYALRMVPLVYQGISPLRSRALAWDRRNEWILQEKASGKNQILVPAFDSIARLTELKEDPGNWVNKCAAEYYGVEGISAVEYFNNEKPYFQ